MAEARWHDYRVALERAPVPDLDLARRAVASEAAARARLADELGHEVDLFAYPFGDVDAVQRISISHVGYQLAVTSRAGWSTRFDDPFDLPPS